MKQKKKLPLEFGIAFRAAGGGIAVGQTQQGAETQDHSAGRLGRNRQKHDGI